MNAREIEELVGRHLREANAGVVDRTVSDLVRGESTIREYFVLKVDVEGSTRFLYLRQSAPYVKLAHTFLSTVDRIMTAHGADPEQTEYHGDSVLAFFPSYGNAAEDVLYAAVRANFAVKRLRELDPDFKSQGLKTRTLLHYGKLSVANIGPFRESHRAVIGLPIHFVASKEKQVKGGVIWASNSFAAELPVMLRAKFLNRNHKIEVVRKEVPVVNPPSTLGSLLGGTYQPYGVGGLAQLAGLGGGSSASAFVNALKAKSPIDHQNELARRLYSSPASPPATTEWKDVEQRTNDGWVVNLSTTYAALHLPLIGSSIR